MRYATSRSLSWLKSYVSPPLVSSTCRRHNSSRSRADPVLAVRWTRVSTSTETDDPAAAATPISSRAPGVSWQQPRLQDGLHHRREHLRFAAVPAGPQRLDDEERVALRLGVQPVGVRGGQIVAEPPGQRGGLGAVQPAQRELGAAAERPQPGEQPVQRVPGVGLGEPGRRGHQQRRLRFGAQQVVQELQGGRVGGVQVVGDQQHRAGAGVQGADHRVEQPQA